MLSSISISCTIFYILIQIIVLISAKCISCVYNNDTNYQSAWKTGRSKRSLADRMPLELKIKIKLVTGNEFDLHWFQKSQYLANEHLPIITPILEFNENVMSDIGEFVLYHDVNKYSAIVYFEKSHTLHGIIGTNYYIRDLPFNFNENGDHMGGEFDPYVVKHDNSLAHFQPKIPIPSSYNTKYPFDDNLESNFDTANANNGPNDVNNNKGKNDKLYVEAREYYLEILIFITRDIVEIFKQYFGMDHHIEWIVRYQIVYFNAVNMIFQKLRSNKISMQINIAKIIIEDELVPFDFLNDGELQYVDIVNKLPQYLRNNYERYEPDSFDSIFISTSRPIWGQSSLINGMTRVGMNLYESRKYNEYYNVVPITVVRFQYYYSDYIIAVQEIGQIFHVNIDSKKKISKFTCYDPNNTKRRKCNDCLEWTNESKEYFTRFFSQSTHRCFLLNEPRSLRPPGPSHFLTPHRQCLCYGYYSYIKHCGGAPASVVKLDGCSKPLQCLIDDSQTSELALTVRPFDGTKCTDTKVCWNGECVKY